MRNKYGNRKVTVGFEVFDSQKEYGRYKELRLLEDAGKIYGIERQVPFVLIPDQYERYERYSEKTGKRLKDGKRMVERGVRYVADFVYSLQDGTMVVEDCKGYRTKEYILKRKMMLYMLGIRIKEV